jgi:amino-acid N-acetyltransferase
VIASTDGALAVKAGTEARMKIIAGPPESRVRRLLSEAELPTSDITPEKLGTFYACESDCELVGVVGLELYGKAGLLRSLVVSPRSRSRGLGSALVAHAEGVAQASGVVWLYLLTTAAERFFRRLGYEKVPREVAPPEIQRTPEFSAICPVSSAFMIKRLPASPVA